MATALEVVTGGAGLLGALGTGEVLNAAESADCLALLNEMLDSWSTDRLFVYQLAKYQYTWPNGQISQTVGIGGDIPITRPVRCEDSYFQTSNGISYPCNKLTRQAYDAISFKTLGGGPMCSWFYYDTSYPLGTLYVYPVTSGGDLFLNYWLALPQFTSLTDVVVLPPGYLRALRFNFAVEAAGYFQLQVPPAVAAVASSAAGKIKRLNAPDIRSVIEPAYNRNYSIYRDY